MPDFDKGRHVLAPMGSRCNSWDKKCRNLTLQHMLYEVPRLLQLIPTPDVKAIFATSRGLRQCVHDCCTSTCLTATATDLQLLIDQKWPPLLAQKLNIIRGAKGAGDSDRDLHALASAQWPKLAVLDLSVLHLEADAIQNLSCAHLPSLTAVNLADNRLHDDAIKELVKSSWPRLEKLNLSYQLPSSAFDSTAAAYLVKGGWPLLKTLNVSGNNVCIGQLVNGKWPALTELTLLNMIHDEDAATAVKETSGLAWPSLKRLSLSDGALDDLGIAELSMAEWPCLEFVCLDGVSAGKVAEIFASCEWPALSRLELRRIDIADKGALMCTRLSRVHLPVLDTLVIDECRLDAAAIAELVKAAWELLRHVQFSRIPIGAAGVAQLVQANWHNLQVLDISCCALSFEAVLELTRGQWPLLHTLFACETEEFLWPTASVKCLLDGVWPVLSEVVLSPSNCGDAAFLLSGSSDIGYLGCGHDFDFFFYPLNDESKKAIGCGRSPWPCLKLSAFVFPEF